MIIQIGPAQFETLSADAFSYHQLERMSQWRWEEVPIIENTGILQFAGKDNPTMTFSGTLIEYHAERDRLKSIEDLADEKQPLAVTGDDGTFYGFYVITALRENGTIYRPGQRTAVMTEWTISIQFYGNKKEQTG